MDYISTVTTFLGWCTVINLGLYIFSAFAVFIFNAPVKSIHSRISRIPADKLDEFYFSFLGNYKLAIFVTNLAPYIALKIMAT